MKYNELFARTELLIGSEALQQIAIKKIILFGVGGVGSWCAEGLIRSGVMNLTIVDSDRVAAVNINRQLQATTKTIGELKVDALKKRLKEINPSVVITAIPKTYNPESSASFHLEEYDYIIDAIDSLSNKSHLLIAASKTDAVTFSSMGAGLKLDPQKIKVTEFWKVRGCKLGAALREKMKNGEKTAKPILCVYSEEMYKNKGENALTNTDEFGSFMKTRINGTMVHITAIFGFTLSGLVIQDIIYKSNSKADIPNII